MTIEENYAENIVIGCWVLNAGCGMWGEKGRSGIVEAFYEAG